MSERRGEKNSTKEAGWYDTDRNLERRGEKKRVNTRKTGAEKEQLAAEYLTAQGMKIVERNFRYRQGEIDIIGYHKQYLVFVEVKYRSAHAPEKAMEAVPLRKQKQICKVADYYRYLHSLGNQTMVRYDVIAIQGEQLEWVQNAFAHRYNRG